MKCNIVKIQSIQSTVIKADTSDLFCGNQNHLFSIAPLVRADLEGEAI